MTEKSCLELAQASRILFKLGVVDAFGHVSKRHPEHADRFLMSKSMAPGLVTPEDIIEHDLDGEPISNPGTRVFLERFIHAELYRERPEINAVVHSHAASVLPFTAVDEPVQPIAHTCGFLHGVKHAFDPAVMAGDGTDLLIRNRELGLAFAKHFGDQKVGLMRNHGFTTVGSSVPEAVYRAAYTATNCELQIAAMQLGKPRYLSPAEALACDKSTMGQVDRVWDLWISQYGEII